MNPKRSGPDNYAPKDTNGCDSREIDKGGRFIV